jgi:hypothetical protein
MNQDDWGFSSPARYQEFDGLTAVQLGQVMENLAGEIDEIEENLKVKKAKLEHLKVHILPENMEKEGLQNFRLASGRGITIEQRLQVSTVGEHKEAFFQWLKDSGNGALVTENVNANTLKSFIKGCLERAEEYPTEMVRVHVTPTAKFLASTKPRTKS